LIVKQALDYYKLLLNILCIDIIYTIFTYITALF